MLDSLPTELKIAVLNQCDYGSLVNLLSMNKMWYELSLPLTKNTEQRVTFLCNFEISCDNIIESRRLDRNFLLHERKLYACFMCLKMKRSSNFATGQILGILTPRKSRLR